MTQESESLIYTLHKRLKPSGNPNRLPRISLVGKTKGGGDDCFHVMWHDGHNYRVVVQRTE